VGAPAGIPAPDALNGQNEIAGDHICAWFP
jgi:hypothetical protein